MQDVLKQVQFRGCYDYKSLMSGSFQKRQMCQFFYDRSGSTWVTQIPFKDGSKFELSNVRNVANGCRKSQTS